MFPLNERFVVTFFRHPRLIDLQNSKTVYEWTEISSGCQTNSIICDEHPPPIALDPTKKRFAVADANSIAVVEIDVESLLKSCEFPSY